MDFYTHIIPHMSIAATKLDPEAFSELFGLFKNYKWLNKYEGALVELWNMCDEKDQHNLIIELFDRFTFINGDQLEDIAETISVEIGLWGLMPPDTYIAAIADKGETDGSAAGLQYMKNKFPYENGWEESFFIPTITQAANEINSNENLILFDDFIGTGKTLKRKYDYVVKTLHERRVELNSLSIISFAGMKFGIDNLIDYIDGDVKVYCPVILKKGITDYETEAISDIKKLLMIDLESKLSRTAKHLKISKHSLGYDQSEALFQIQGYNCPNNLFPIFWWPLLDDHSNRKVFFKRNV